MHCIALRHLAFEDLGVLAPVLHEQGASIEYWDGGRCAYDDRAWLEADLAVVLGGPVGVGDEARYPFLRDELRLVKARLDAGLPLLGVVPEDDALPLCMNRGIPILLADGLGAAAAYRNIAKRLQGERVPLLRIR